MNSARSLRLKETKDIITFIVLASALHFLRLQRVWQIRTVLINYNFLRNKISVFKEAVVPR